MLELRNWYRERLPARISALESARSMLARDREGAVETILRIAHSLRGSGSTYGFPGITEAARALEERGEEGLAAGLDGLLDALRRALEAVPEGRTGILVVEDDEDQAHYAQAVLAGPGREIHVARSAAQAQAVLEEKEVSLILLDLILPDCDGRSLLLKLRERLATAAVPVVVVSVKSAAQVREECLALGADDYLEKPVPREVLEAAVGARLRQGSDLVREFRRDPLTGLPNRAAFHEAFLRARAAASSSGEALTAGILDFDRFRDLRERLGGPGGDAVLRRAAGAVARTLRTSDFIARRGGAEFVILFPKTEPAGAAVALRKGLRALEEVAELPVRVSFCAGLASVTEGMTVEEAVAEADRFLCHAQAQGAGRIVACSDPLRAPRRRVLLAEDDELIRLVVKRLLEREGCEVSTFGDGAEALEGARGAEYSLVISDVQMPRMDGLQLVSSLRRLPAYAATPVVMLTAMGREEDVLRGYEHGADDYIVKPFSSGELVTRVRRLFKKPPVAG
jgi:diguanylate cyclase (GGDEF)-like protein